MLAKSSLYKWSNLNCHSVRHLFANEIITYKLSLLDAESPKNEAERNPLNLILETSKNLALAVLRGAACLAQTVLLALDLACVAGQVAAGLELGAKVRVDLDQSASDAQLDRVGLTARTATLDGDERVVASGGAGDFEGL